MAKDGVIQRVVWSRSNPDRALLAEMERGTSGLLYPVTAVGGKDIRLGECENFMLQDAIWQGAHKMHNRSPYLQAAGRVSLSHNMIRVIA